ncbi:hypothetical protein AB0392_24715 [Nonomuraea angiospora]|uniref:hypothetical protein n=1 Tax=Nonomuraea angiospora TaxID=46172 RepID=UPI0034503F57
MSDRDWQAIRYRPFANPVVVAMAKDYDAVPVQRDADPDMARHRYAVRRARTHAVAFPIAHHLWWGFAFPVYALVDARSLIWPALAVAAGIAVMLAVLYTVAGRAAHAIRDADEEIGLPLPMDLVEDIASGGVAMHLLASVYDNAQYDPETAARLRRYRRRFDAMDQAYLRQLHRARQAWVAGDRKRWRAAAQEALKLSERTYELLDTTGFLP